MKTLNIELLALDLAVCSRCGGTLANLHEALKSVRPALAVLGIEAVPTQTLVESEQQAERLRFASSPTIRIEGEDIVGAVRETSCGSCTDLSGSSEDIECRVWPWRGRTFDAAPTGLLVEAILRAALATGERREAKPWKGVPENIRAVLRSKTGKHACCDPKSEDCCGTARSETCCEPACCQ